MAIVGAITGYALCWLVVLTIGLLAVVQATAAAVGAACKTSLQGAIVRRFGMGWGMVTLLAIVAVSTLTLVADLKAGSEALDLLTGVRAEFFVLPLAIVVGLLLVTHSFERIERVLQLLPLAFAGYAASAILAHFDAEALLRGIFLPHFVPTFQNASMAVAILGTTLTIYVYVWESLEVARRRPAAASAHFYKWDAAIGMLLVGVIFLFIVVASAATLGAHHLSIATAADLARALTPLAGPWASTLFGIGLLGSAILVVPILASTNAYAIAHTFGWSGTLDSELTRAKRFYAVILASLALAAAAAFSPVSPVSLLYWASIAGGLATPVTLYFLVRIACDRVSMGPARIGRPLATSAWAVAGVVTLASAIFLATAWAARTSG